MDASARAADPPGPSNTAPRAFGWELPPPPVIFTTVVVPAATAVVAFELAEAEPEALVAVTTTRTVEPMSAEVGW